MTVSGKRSPGEIEIILTNLKHQLATELNRGITGNNRPFDDFHKVFTGLNRVDVYKDLLFGEVTCPAPSQRTCALMALWFSSPSCL